MTGGYRAHVPLAAPRWRPGCGSVRVLGPGPRGWRARVRHRSRCVCSGTETAPAAAISDPDIRAPGGDGAPLWRSFTPARLAECGLSRVRRPALKAIAWQPLVMAVGGLFEASRDVRTVVLSVSMRPKARASPVPLLRGLAFARHLRMRHVAGAAPCPVSWPSPVDAPRMGRDGASYGRTWGRG